MILYRPVGLQEMELIYDSGMKAFPAGLPQQPIFYPVLDLEYARQTASGWNTKRKPYAGYVTQFKVEDEYIHRIKKHKVSGTAYEELWIPAEELQEFNRHIVGHIKVVEAYFGDKFQGFVPEQHTLHGKDAIAQFTELANSYIYKRMEFYLEIKRNHKAVFLNYPFWQQYDSRNENLKEKILQAIKDAWLASFPKNPLPAPPPVSENTTKRKVSASDPVQDDSREAEQPSRQPRPKAAPAPVHKEPPRPKPTFPRPAPKPEPDDWEDDLSDEDTPVEPPKPKETIGPRHEEPPAPSQTYPRHTPEPEPQDWEDDFLDEDKPVEPPRPKTIIVPRHEGPPRPKQNYPRPASTPDPDEAEDDLPDEETSVDDAAVASPKPTATMVPRHEEPPRSKQTYPRPAPKPEPDDVVDAEEIDEPVAVTRVPEQAPPAKLAVDHFSQGIHLGLGGNYEEAVAELFSLLEEEPNHATAYSSLGVAFHRLGEDERALAAYDTALRIDPRNADAHYFRANILYSQGHVREAIADYTRAIGLQPELIDAHQRPVPEDRLTDYNATPAELHRIATPAHRILYLTRMLEANPTQADHFRSRAAEYSRLGNHEGAIADYTSYLALRPDDARVYHLRGLAFEQIGQSERAAQDLRQAVALDPQILDTYMERGVTFGKMGNYRQSVASLSEGIRLASDNPDAYFNRGMSYFNLGEFERAADDFSNVIRLTPGDEAAYYWRGLANESMGRQEEAFADFRQFLAISRDPDARAEIERKLNQRPIGRKIGGGLRNLLAGAWQKIDPSRSEMTQQSPALHDLLTALGERAQNSVWLASDVDARGDAANELHALSDQNMPIEGQDLVRIASGLRRIRQGDFHAFDPGAASQWLLIRAWGGNGFYLETADLQVSDQLRSQLPELEEVEGAQPPFQAWYIESR